MTDAGCDSWLPIRVKRITYVDSAYFFIWGRPPPPLSSVPEYGVSRVPRRAVTQETHFTSHNWNSCDITLQSHYLSRLLSYLLDRSWNSQWYGALYFLYWWLLGQKSQHDIVRKKLSDRRKRLSLVQSNTVWYSANAEDSHLEPLLSQTRTEVTQEGSCNVQDLKASFAFSSGKDDFRTNHG